ncbi:hypothetical protein D0Z07_3768 [Hyphodiscus hymeniophilus]|uniref:Uncharacterized protein n=1 Tax=Hyphodiscus hymeniophilus TaxID=353542 RepID=A0A9P6VKH5_9HELO|nr:hypothetical protein D0Z07_3768 [Hyphodiscus hymeniophilus]
MATLNALNPLNITKRASRTQYSELPFHERKRSRDTDDEKYEDPETSEDDSDYSSYHSSPVSSRETSGSYSSNRPMLRRKSTGTSRSKTYRLPQRVVRYMCLALISTIVIFMLSLVRMSIVSSRRVEVGDLGNRPPPPPPLWESFEFLTRYYGGIRSLVPASENNPEYPLPEDESPNSNQTLVKESIIPVRNVTASQPFQAYRNQTTKSYLAEYAPAQECFLDAKSTARIPSLQFYNGRPSGFPENVMGSYDLLDLPEDICFERYGRLGPYGLGYGLRNGGTGAGEHGDLEGSETVWVDGHVDYRKINWGEAQKRCYQANAARFEPKTPYVEGLKTFSISVIDPLPKREEQSGVKKSNSTLHPKKFLPRTAVVIRSWDDFEYREEDVMHLRAMISELSLGSGAEYDVHLLVQVKDEAKHPIWADEATYQQHLKDSVPEEFHEITTLWSVTQMLMLYQGIYDNYVRGPELPAHGSYRGLQMAMQHFAHRHPEYDFFWHWEIDIRYTGHYYDLFSSFDSWSKEQPRKGLWERNARFYVPSVHGTWDDFKQMVRVQTEMGLEGSNNVWSGIKGVKTAAERPKGDSTIWGPERPEDPSDWFETENDPKPPTSYEKDKYAWGVGEDADLITLNPLFDPEGTTWFLASDITGYNISTGLPPRRAAIVTSSRMSRRLLTTMHRETAFKNHHAFSEMWAPTTALHHGYKAVYVPHPMFVDRVWPTEYLAAIMNAGRNGATGGARTSVFGEREHNLKGMTWYYNAGFAPNLWKRWLGLKVDNEGGEEFELVVNEGRNGSSLKVDDMRGGEGRMCLPPMLIHPVKGVELPVEGSNAEEELPESDPAA